MARKIAPVPKLTPRQKKVYAHLCRKLRFPLIYNHARGCYLAINDALEELHGSQASHPGLSVGVDTLLGKRATRILHDMDITSMQHLVDVEWKELLEEMQEHKMYDVLVGIEVNRIREKYLLVAGMKPPPASS